jgi:hypothetical protein
LPHFLLAKEEMKTAGMDKKDGRHDNLCNNFKATQSIQASSPRGQPGNFTLNIK